MKTEVRIDDLPSSSPSEKETNSSGTEMVTSPAFPEAQAEDPTLLELRFAMSLAHKRPDDVDDITIFLGRQEKPYTLCLDLDETLACHTSRLPGKSISEKPEHYILRPGLAGFLREVSKDFELVLFTAASLETALEALSLIDPLHVYFKCVLSRDHCVRLEEELFVKDLRVLGDRDLDNTLIVDNSIVSFAFQLSNGIPIQSFLGKDEDTDLAILANYINSLKNFSTLVSGNRRLLSALKNQLQEQSLLLYVIFVLSLQTCYKGQRSFNYQ
eukprot:TRINITY_DN866_c0_g1_i1.p2 TRINITY_DN866_c0_g1~~TRINITY_DN866_c0_g1_i1.p2  ORF type:complete len:271 (+),score=17.16 TRINITY_DN866_c0_g1_i1:262-1074(+)